MSGRTSERTLASTVHQHSRSRPPLPNRALPLPGRAAPRRAACNGTRRGHYTRARSRPSHHMRREREKSARTPLSVHHYILLWTGKHPPRPVRLSRRRSPERTETSKTRTSSFCCLYLLHFHLLLVFLAYLQLISLSAPGDWEQGLGETTEGRQHQHQHQHTTQWRARRGPRSLLHRQGRACLTTATRSTLRTPAGTTRSASAAAFTYVPPPLLPGASKPDGRWGVVQVQAGTSAADALIDQ